MAPAPPVLDVPTLAWIGAAPDLPALTGAASVAERLLLLLHYGVDWDSWVAGYRATYWDQVLPDRVVVATFLADTLHGWWTHVSHDLCSTPRDTGQRREVVQLLASDPLPVLAVLRSHTPALVLRVRVIAEAVRATRPDAAGPSTPVRASRRRRDLS